MPAADHIDVPALLKRVVELQDFCLEEVRRMELLASALRNPKRAVGVPAYPTIADAFERAAERHREILK